MSSWFGVGGSAFRTIDDRPMLVETVAFPAYTRETMRRTGFFDEELVRNQDDEYNYRLLKLGGKILLSPDIRSRYYSRSSLRKLWRQYYQYGFWKVRVMQKHPRQMRWRQFVPFAFVLSLLLTAVAALILPNGWILPLLILAAYLLADGAAAVMVGRRHGFRHVLPLVAIYPILHVSYGFGFLVGLLRFAGRWRQKEPQWQFETEGTLQS
jgi:succinoglycan biosynthesis protein ExoA